MLLVLPYWIFPSPLTLIIAGIFLMTLSAVPLIRFTKERLGKKPALFIGIAYLFSFGISKAVIMQFHEVAFALPICMYALIAWLNKNRKISFILMGMLVFVKEDLGATVALFALITLFLDAYIPGSSLISTIKSVVHNIWKKPAFYLFIWGIVWFFLTTLVLIPFFNTSSQYDYTSIKEFPPLNSISDLGDFFARRWAYALMLIFIVASAGIWGITSPYILLTLPILGWRFISTRAIDYGIDNHHNSTLMPFVFVALLDVLMHIRKQSENTASQQTKHKLVKKIRIALYTSTILALISTFMFTGKMVVMRAPTSTHEYTIVQQWIYTLTDQGQGHNILTDKMASTYTLRGNRVFDVSSYDDFTDIDIVAISPYSYFVAPIQNNEETIDHWAQRHFGGSWITIYDNEGYRIAIKQ